MGSRLSSPTIFKEFAQVHTPRINGVLADFLNQGCLENNELLYQAMKYSLLMPSSKRIRPLLVLAAMSLGKGEMRTGLEAAAAIEMVHTFSLIHDDLPGLDNDDFRRGELANHKVFGQGQAILAGDGLLSLAFSLMLGLKPAQIALHSCQELAEAVGPRGMIAGESLDIASLRNKATIGQLEQITLLKTARLIEASVVIGGLVGQLSALQLNNLRSYGKSLGCLFQLTDDKLDRYSDSNSTMSDILEDEEYQNLLDHRLEIANRSLAIFGPAAATLGSLAKLIRNRANENN